MHTYKYIRIQTHTHSSQPTDVCDQWGSCTCFWNMQLLWQEKERDYKVTGAFSASTQKWHRWHHPHFVAQNESLRTGNTAIWRVSLSIHILQQNSWEQCCQFFLTLEKLWRYSFEKKLNMILRSPSGIWRHFLFGSFGWCVSDSWLHLNLCRVGLVRFVSSLFLTSLLHSVSLTAGWFSAFVHTFISLVIQHLLSSF